MILLQKLKRLLNSLRHSKKNESLDSKASVSCDVCNQITQYFYVSSYKNTKICMKCYEEYKWSAKVKQKEVITKDGF